MVAPVQRLSANPTKALREFRMTSPKLIRYIIGGWLKAKVHLQLSSFQNPVCPGGPWPPGMFPNNMWVRLTPPVVTGPPTPNTHTPINHPPTLQPHTLPINFPPINCLEYGYSTMTLTLDDIRSNNYYRKGPISGQSTHMA